MQTHMPVLQSCPLFADMAPEDIPAMLSCLSARKGAFPRQDMVFHEGETATAVGIVLTGRVHILQEDFWGNRSILAGIGPGGLFGEAFACAGTERLPVSVLAVEPCEVLFIDYRRIVTTCPSACTYHAALIRNMIGVLAGKNVQLTQKLWQVTRRTTRQKLLSYLSAEAAATGNNPVTVPFSRQELADYLAVDRSAMSSELSRMQREGLLRCDRSRFTLLRED